MRAIPWPELITPTGATIGVGVPGDGAFIPPLTDTNAELSMEGMAIGAILMTDQRGASMEGMAIGAILTTSGQDGPSMESMAIGVILQLT